MTSTTQSAWRTSNGPMSSSRFGPFLQLLSRLSLAYRVRRERRALLALGDRGLKDIGLSRADVQREVNRGFWDIPMQR